MRRSLSTTPPQVQEEEQLLEDLRAMHADQLDENCEFENDPDVKKQYTKGKVSANSGTDLEENQQVVSQKYNMMGNSE